jgi:hypothetical protein
MKRWLALLVALLVMGCEDTYVREHIIDNFVCVYMPWWMGECDGEEVTAKVMGVLDHGIVSAQARCICSLHNDIDDAENGVTYTAQRLVDGSCLITEAPLVPTKLCSLSDACSVDCSGNGVSLSGGLLSHVASPGPHGTYSADMSTCCTGFNLEAFGVEE